MAKVEKLLANDPSAQCDIELAKTTDHHNKGDIFKAEIHIVGKHKNVYVSSEKSDLYMAIDAVSDEIVQGIDSEKKKRLAFVRRGGAKVKSMMKGLWPWK
jgi:ribosome-associated translation inhibitor RaiA